jgi:hypothetical protein
LLISLHTTLISLISLHTTLISLTGQLWVENFRLGTTCAHATFLPVARQCSAEPELISVVSFIVCYPSINHVWKLMYFSLACL